MVVDLSVIGNRQAAILIGHRLAGALREIDDRQTAMAESNALIGCDPGGRSIRSSMRHRVAHPGDVGLGNAERSGGERQRAVNSAHLMPCGRRRAWSP